MELLRLEAAALGSAGGSLLLDFPIPPGAVPPRAPTSPPRALLSLRAAGSMRYLLESPNAAREAYFAALGLGPGRLVGTELHHTRRIRFIEGGRPPGAEGSFELDARLLSGEDSGDGGPDGAAGRDGLVVGPGAAAWDPVPTVTVADCMPIWLLDFSSGAYGVLHSGWKGTGILAEAVRGLAARYGSPPGGLSLILGPAVGPCCYEVPPERANYFRESFGEAAVDDSGPRPRLNLRAANLALAESLGVGALLSVEACTACEPLLGSYRREGAASFTRMAAACGRL